MVEDKCVADFCRGAWACSDRRGRRRAGAAKRWLRRTGPRPSCNKERTSISVNVCAAKPLGDTVRRLRKIALRQQFPFIMKGPPPSPPPDNNN